MKVNRWGHFYFKGGIYAETIFRHELTLHHSGFLLFRNKICPEVFKISKSVLQSKTSSSIFLSGNELKLNVDEKKICGISIVFLYGD